MKRVVSDILLLGLCLLSLASCRRIPLHDPLANVYLKLTTRLNTDVVLNEDLNIEGNPSLANKVYGQQPTQVRACFYDIESHKLVQEQYLPAEGGFVEIPAGTYDLIVYSLGAAITRIDNVESRAAAYAYTDPTGSVVRSKTKVGDVDEDGEVLVNEQKVIKEPDHIFVGRRESIVVPVRAEIDQTVIIECELTPLLDTYSFEVRNVIGAGRIQKADVYITGQAPSRFLWDKRYPTKPSALYFQTTINPDKGHIYTVFNTFGKLPGARNDVFLHVLVTDVQGGRFEWEFDVTDQFDNPDNVHHEIIIDERVEIPEDGGQVGGLDPKVNEWSVIVVPIDVE